MNYPTNIKQNISYNEIITIRDTLEIGSIERLLLSIYTIIYPLKYDYYSVKLLTYPNMITTSNNYISLSKSTAILYVKNFNTSLINGIVCHKLPECLINEINMSLLKKPRKYLFTNEYNKPFTQISFIKWVDKTLTHILKKEMTLKTFRYIIRSTINLNNKLNMLFKCFDGFGKSLYVNKNNLHTTDGSLLDDYNKHYLLLMALDDD